MPETTSDPKWDAFAVIYNDPARYPTLSDVASALGISYRTARHNATMLRRMHQKGDNVPAIILRIARH